MAGFNCDPPGHSVARLGLCGAIERLPAIPASLGTCLRLAVLSTRWVTVAAR
jgi:hypothetical protein